MASEIGQNITPAFASSPRKVVATETESKTASTATTPASTFCSSNGIPNFAYVFNSSGSTSSSDAGPSTAFGAA